MHKKAFLKYEKMIKLAKTDNFIKILYTQVLIKYYAKLLANY